MQRTTDTETSADTSSAKPTYTMSFLTAAADSKSTTGDALPRLQEYIQSVGKPGHILTCQVAFHRIIRCIWKSMNASVSSGASAGGDLGPGWSCTVTRSSRGTIYRAIPPEVCLLAQRMWSPLLKIREAQHACCAESTVPHVVPAGLHIS